VGVNSPSSRKKPRFGVEKTLNGWRKFSNLNDPDEKEEGSSGAITISV
jgi:hypothetical protein